MKWAVIGTWDMSYEGTCIAAKTLKKKTGKCAPAVLDAIENVEDNELFHSVGNGGWPDEKCHVVLDGGFMDGDTLHFGAVGSIQGFRSPARIAYSLKDGDANNFLVGKGAEKYALEHGFEKRNNLTKDAKKRYQNEAEKMKKLKAYDGHDTVCFVALDQKGHMCTGTSTSGLFMKKEGRVGDTPLPGNGFYCDSLIGGACATGMGEEIMKGALSYAIVNLLDAGLSAMEAAQKAVDDLTKKLTKRNGYAQEMSVICLDKHGNFGIGTNCPFTFTYASDEMNPKIFQATPTKKGIQIEEISAEERLEHRKVRNKELIEGK